MFDVSFGHVVTGWLFLGRFGLKFIVIWLHAYSTVVFKTCLFVFKHSSEVFDFYVFVFFFKESLYP